ncbi:hypothetical protein ACB289_21235, partial [Aeromonas caviae]
ADPIKARAGKRLTDRPDTLTQTTSGNQFKLADKEQTIHFLLPVSNRMQAVACLTELTSALTF